VFTTGNREISKHSAQASLRNDTPLDMKAIAVLSACLAATVLCMDISLFNAATSTVVCGPQPVTAGHQVTCHITLKDTAGGPWGDAFDACKFRMQFCPASDGGRGAPPLVNATFVGAGAYRISFNPLVSGVNTLTAAVYDGLTGIDVAAVSPASLNVEPNVVKASRSTSNCARVYGITKCNVKHRDAFDNVVSSCSSYTTAVTGQTASTCHVLSN
jgi:hypothetical protein